MKNLFKFSLGLLILFSLSTIVKAQAIDYEYLIITPAKYEGIAQDFIKLHDGTVGPIDGTPWKVNGAYVLLENIIGRYDGEPAGEIEPAASADPGSVVPATPGQDQIGKAYTNAVVGSVIKFLRGIEQYEQEHQMTNYRADYFYAYDILRDVNGNAGIISPLGESKFKYLLILGDTGAAGPGAVTFNGVPESWYVYMNEGTYNQDPDADGSWFPTDFFYAAPNYYNGINWVPSLRVGRLPIHDLEGDLNNNPPNTVTEITAIDTGFINAYGWPSGSLSECDVCDSTPNPRWAAGAWAPTIAGGTVPGSPGTIITDAYELVITSNGNGNTTNATGATYLILDNTETCLRVLGSPDQDGVEPETETEAGDRYEIRRTIDNAEDVYDKNEAYVNEIVPDPTSAWNNWYRKVVTAGGDSDPTLFSFWDEFVHAKIINDGLLEGNEIIKLRHTNKDDVDATNDFTVTSLAPYLQDGVAGTDCGLLFLLGGDTIIVDALRLDDAYIYNADLLAYTSSDSHIPIIVSNTAYHTLFDYLDADIGLAYPSFGAAAVESSGANAGGAIAYIGSTDFAYSGITPYFTEGVLEQDRLYNFDELLSYTIESFHTSPKFLGDIFMGSPAMIARGQGPFNQFLASNLETDGQDTGLLFWASQKTVWEYTLLGDPCLPIPHPNIGVDPIETYTAIPDLAFDKTTLRNRTPQYESHDIGVDEIPTGGPASTTVNITTNDDNPSSLGGPRAVPQIKITRVDIRRDTGVDYPAPAAPAASYTFPTLNTAPGYYFVKVEQPGYDIGVGWGTWWEKERWIYVQEVNQFTQTPANDILVVDDDFGYPVVTLYAVPKAGYFYSWDTRGYEDWYLKALDNVVGPGNYDVWHVDYDDHPPARYPGGDDDWAGADSGDALMHGEIYSGLLNSYDKVIWLTGDSSGYWQPSPWRWPNYDQVGNPMFATHLIETITEPEENYLKDYLYNRGRLFLSGQGILRDLGCEGIREEDAIVEGQNNTWCERRTGEDTLGIQNEFLTDYLKITDLHSSYEFGYLSILNRVSGNPVISGNLTIDIAGDYGAQNQFFFVDAEPNLDTPIVARIFEYDLSGGGNPPHIGVPEYPFIGTGGLAYYRGGYAYVFLPWGFEAIDSQIHRNLVMGAILSWFDAPTRTGPGTEPGVPDPGGPGDGGGGVGSLSGCFIATACYGTPMAKEVQALSAFRDEYLLSNSLGRFFVGNYYKFSPRVSEYISQRPVLRKLVRFGLKPLVCFSEKLVK